MAEEAFALIPVVQEQTLIEAKVPILRIKFTGPFSDIIVDLNANNVVAIRNTHLLCYYAFCKFFSNSHIFILMCFMFQLIGASVH